MSTGTQVRRDPQREHAAARSGVRPGRAEVLGARLTEARVHASAIGAVAVVFGSLCILPLLDGAWWFTRTVVVVAVITLVGVTSRTLRIPAPVTPLLQFGALLFTLAMLFARDEARWGVLPGPAALSRLRELAAQGRDYAVATQPPAGPDAGLLLLIVAGIGLAALVVDTLAAGLDLPGMTLIPLAALFLVPWAINRGTAPWWAFAVIALGWLAILSALQRDRAAQWSPGARPGSPGTGLVIAGTITALALIAGGLTTLRGPAESVDVSTGSGGGSVQLDALVSLRRSLVSNDTRPVMTMATTTTRPDYLRLSILETFDGEQWGPVQPSESGPVPPALGDGSRPSAGQPPPGPLAEYQLDVGPLAGATLPSPRGTFTTLNDWPVVWDQRTSLPIRADGGSVQGTRIGLVAAEQTLDGDALRAASTVPPRPEQVFPENLEDPAPLTGDELPELAREITAGAATPFDAAIALQRWFTTDGGFSYSTQIEGGSSGDALGDFLDQRIGYCEQFAATMALMARSVGIPARVAVGFTQGRLEVDQWIVRGTDAHAWPELWMGSAGWVRFEPTPGAPTATTPTYTGSSPTNQTPTEAPTEASAAPSEAPGDAPAQVPDEAEGFTADGQAAQTGLPIRRILLLLGVALLLLPGLVRVARRRRRVHRGDAESMYQEIVDTTIDLRLGGELATPRATLAEVSHLLLTPDAGQDDAGSADAIGAVQRIQHAVEWQRYGMPEHAQGTRGRRATLSGSGGSDPDGTPEERPAGGRAGGTLVADPATPGDSAKPSQALTGDLRIVRRALARRGGWTRRLLATAVPRSVTGVLSVRGQDGGGSQ